MSTLDEIRKNSRLTKMRLGQEAPEIVALKSNSEIRMALVPLTEKERMDSITQAARLEVPDNSMGLEIRDRYMRACDLHHALREKDDIEQKVFPSAEELMMSLEDIDINYLAEEYLMMQDFSSPAIEGMSDEALEELKKALLTIDMSVLSGKPWWHLKQFFLTLGVGQLKVKLPGSGSTSNSTTSSESESESIPGA
jgi:hypothetical protein